MSIIATRSKGAELTEGALVAVRAAIDHLGAVGLALRVDGDLLPAVLATGVVGGGERDNHVGALVAPAAVAYIRLEPGTLKRFVSGASANGARKMLTVPEGRFSSARAAGAVGAASVQRRVAKNAMMKKRIAMIDIALIK